MFSPTLRVGVPNAVGEQAIQIGKVGIAVDVEAQAERRPFLSGVHLSHS